MCKKIVAVVLSLVLPATASAGSLKEAVEKAARELAAAQEPAQTAGRSRFWTGIALLAGGGVLTLLGATEMFDDEDGPEDPEDMDESDDGEDSDWGNKALIGGGVAAAALGGYLLWTGRQASPSRITVQPGRVTIRHTVRF